MVIWLPEHKICFAGNLFSALFGHFPNLVTLRGDRYRDALTFVASFDRVAALEPELLLVGHHDPVRGKEQIAEELARLRAAVLHVHDATVDGMNRSKSVHTLMSEISLPENLQVGEGYGKVSWCVRAIWEHYVGWFHHASATELYAVPASSVHGDLVDLAGGTDAVAASAQSKLDSGELLQAIHLCEAGLAVEPTHVGALTVSIAAHEQLEQDSENFWLSQFLRKQVRQQRTTLAAEEKSK